MYGKNRYVHRRSVIGKVGIDLRGVEVEYTGTMLKYQGPYVFCNKPDTDTAQLAQLNLHATLCFQYIPIRMQRVLNIRWKSLLKTFFVFVMKMFIK